jgi:hypothetical protein
MWDRTKGEHQLGRANNYNFIKNSTLKPINHDRFASARPRISDIVQILSEFESGSSGLPRFVHAIPYHKRF